MAVTVLVSGLSQRWRAAEGVAVAEGDVVAVIEAMQMETQLLALRAGTLRGMAVEGWRQKAEAVAGRVEGWGRVINSIVAIIFLFAPGLSRQIYENYFLRRLSNFFYKIFVYHNFMNVR